MTELDFFTDGYDLGRLTPDGDELPAGLFMSRDSGDICDVF